MLCGVNFKVVFADSRGIFTKKYKGTDTYEILRGGVLRVDVQKEGLHHFSPGQWIEVAERDDPITPKLDRE
jgi:hypothetical protein